MIRFWIKLGIIEYLVGSSTRGTRALAMNVHTPTAAYRALIFSIKDDNRINALSNAAQDGEAQLFLSATLAQTFNNRSSRLDWCGNYLLSQTAAFHSIRRSGSVYSLLFIVF